jgi:predicted enzyme related to lactoylglutathione lyase
VKLFNVTFDCADPPKVAGFWAELLGRSMAPGSGEFYAFLPGIPGEPNLLFLRVPEGRVGKNRVHLDLDADDLDEARRRVEGLGATFVHEKDEFGVHWMTFQDPEKNEFCIGTH